MSAYGLPEEAQLTFVDIGTRNNLRIELEFPDGTFLQVQFPDGSPQMEELLSLLTRLVNESLQERTDAGVVITGVTPIEEDE